MHWWHLTASQGQAPPFIALRRSPGAVGTNVASDASKVPRILNCPSGGPPFLAPFKRWLSGGQ